MKEIKGQEGREKCYPDLLPAGHLLSVLSHHSVPEENLF